MDKIKLDWIPFEKGKSEPNTFDAVFVLNKYGQVTLAVYNSDWFSPHFMSGHYDYWVFQCEFVNGLYVEYPPTHFAYNPGFEIPFTPIA